MPTEWEGCLTIRLVPLCPQLLQAGDLDLPTTMVATASPTVEVAAIPEASLRDAVDDYQRRLIGAVLAEFGGNWSQAARRLGVDRANLQRLAKRLGLPE